MSKTNPGDFLRTIIGRRVAVRLVSGVDYRGTLACLDGFMNIALEQTEEHINGQVRLVRFPPFPPLSFPLPVLSVPRDRGPT